MSYLIEQVNPVIDRYITDRRKAGKHMFALCGGRRSGKTFAVCQFLLLRLYNYGEVVNVASMTAEQGRLGAYADMSTIVKDCPTLEAYLECVQSPREIRNTAKGGRVIFNSYANSETAKGIACDWLFVNEANNFTKQQVVDLMANVRKGIFFDYNPNIEFWIDDFFEPEEICRTTWKDNPFLTEVQLEYFAQLKRDAEKPAASAVDIRNYNVYYLGQYSELRGQIFTPDNLRFCDEVPSGLHDFRVFCDPSALRGADWFACVLSAKDDAGVVYIVDTFSTNTGSREMICKKLREWCGSYDRVEVYIETNGIIGLDFFDFAYNSGLPVTPWTSRGNKFERIVGNFQNITKNVIFVRTPLLPDFLAQVYDFDTKCEHDDNIDAISSSYNLQRYI